MGKVLLLGIGNELLGDDGVGIHIARYFEKQDLQVFDIKYAGIGGFHLFDYIEGYEKVIIVDAFEKNYPNIESYKVVIYEKDEIIDKSIIYRSHETSLGMGFQLAQKSYPDLVPKQIKFVAIEIPFQTNYSNRLTKHTKKLALKAILKIYCILDSYEIKFYNKHLDNNSLDEHINFLN